MGERLNGIQEVDGSTPFSSTPRKAIASDRRAARKRRAASALLAVAVSLLTAAHATAGGPRAHYRIRAELGEAAPQIDGTVEIDFTNGTQRVLEECLLFLFPNRFAAPGPGINDFNRPYVYPHQDFDPGWMRISAAWDAGRPVSVQPMSVENGPSGTAVRVPIAPLAPGESRTLRLAFRTRLPFRFGPFGSFDQQLTAVGGWYPYLAAVDASGRWRTDWPPPLADFDVEVSPRVPLEMVLNGRPFPASGAARVQLRRIHYVSLVAAPQLLRRDTQAAGQDIVFVRRPPYSLARAHRITPEPPLPEIVLETLQRIIDHRPAQVPAPRHPLPVIQAPLRLELTAPGEGAVIVSDRALEVFPILRPFHELQLAQSVYAELLRPQLARREPAADYWWVSEGLSRVLADRYMEDVHPRVRSTQDWIELFNIFSIVDRFESEPKIPFVGAFFERAREADPLHAQIASFNSDLPPGRVILGKLRQEVGDQTFAEIVDRCSRGVLPFRRCAAAVAGRDLDPVLDQWLAPYPQIDYRFGPLDLNQPEDGRYRSTVTVRRQASRAVFEPVTIGLRSIGGREVDVRWSGRGEVGQVSAQTPWHVCQVVIDPHRRLVEDDRSDNAYPLRPQVVLDTAEVEISSTEFGFSGLLVGRNRYDYRKDLAAAGFYTNRSIGFTAGGRLHWGEPIDTTLYPHNLYLFYGFQALNGDFGVTTRNPVRTPGNLAALGFRYDYSNVFFFDNPTHERSLRLYGDWYDGAFGSDYDYVDWGVSSVLTQALWSYSSVAAFQVLNGFSEPLNGSRVANQGLYSLGGSRSIRGIGAEEQLGRNILMVRAELRQQIYPELDLNLLDLLVLRRPQLRLFIDSGRVENSAGRVYDVGGFAVGGGVGLGAVYEFMGFFPALAYVELATRLDGGTDQGTVQFLFGSRQPF